MKKKKKLEIMFKTNLIGLIIYSSIALMWTVLLIISADILDIVSLGIYLALCKVQLNKLSKYPQEELPKHILTDGFEIIYIK